MKEVSDWRIQPREHKGSVMATFVQTLEARETVSGSALGVLICLKRSCQGKRNLKVKLKMRLEIVEMCCLVS